MSKGALVGKQLLLKWIRRAYILCVILRWSRWICGAIDEPLYTRKRLAILIFIYHISKQENDDNTYCWGTFFRTGCLPRIVVCIISFHRYFPYKLSCKSGRKYYMRVVYPWKNNKWTARWEWTKRDKVRINLRLYVIGWYFHEIWINLYDSIDLITTFTNNFYANTLIEKQL